MSFSHQSENSSSSSSGIFNDKSREDKTKKRYEKVLKLGTTTDEGNALLKKTILSGAGPYVAFAANLMCTHIETNDYDCCSDLGGSYAYSKVFETQEKYLDPARYANKVIGLYYTLLAKLRECNRIGGFEKRMNFYQGIVGQFVEFEMAMKKDPASYQLLAAELAKEQSQAKKLLQSKLDKPESAEDTDSDDEFEMSVLEAKMDSILLVATPLDTLKLNLMKADVNPDGVIAKRIRTRLQPEEKNESANTLSK